MSIVETAVATPALSTLVSVLTSPGYAGVLAALSGAGPFTVFAPTDVAFAKAGVDVTDAATVTEVLKYHVLSGAIPSSALAPAQSVGTLQSEHVYITKGRNGVFVNGGSKVVIADVMASNGVVHVVDTMLVPPSLLNVKDLIYDTITAGRLLYNAGDYEGCFAIYLATAEVLSKSLRAAPLQQAREEGLRRDFSGGAWTLRREFDRFSAAPLPTVSASTPKVPAKAQMSIVETAAATTALSTLFSVLTLPAYAGVLAALSGAGPFTVFAPTDEAFAKAGVDVNDVGVVTEVLKYHVISGAIPSSALAPSNTVPTLQGETMVVTKTSAGVFVNRNAQVGNAQVVIADVMASNGIVHVINAVLMPPSLLAPVKPRPLPPKVAASTSKGNWWGGGFTTGYLDTAIGSLQHSTAGLTSGGSYVPRTSP
jgi:uncharacterized surface protein with fasciclin (FAS1) repeats